MARTMKVPSQTKSSRTSLDLFNRMDTVLRHRGRQQIMNTSALIKGILILTALVLPGTSSAQVPLVWQTTFDNASCPDKPNAPGEHWRTSDYFAQLPGVYPCPGNGITPWAAHPTPRDDRIIAEANNPGGGGGKGFRHYRCDGTNCGGGGIKIDLPTGYTELWARFYMRYQLGFAWLNGAAPLHQGSVCERGYAIGLGVWDTGWRELGNLQRFHGNSIQQIMGQHDGRANWRWTVALL